MFEKISRWLGLAPAEKVEQVAFRKLEALAPLKSAPEKKVALEESQQHSFVCREAVLNRDERIDGYEFSLSRRLQSRVQEKSALVQRVYDDAMLRNLSLSGVSSLLGDRFALIRISPESLKNPLLDSFAQMNVIIMVTPGELAVSDLAEVKNNLQRLNGIGVKYGWALEKPHPEIAELLVETDFIEVESTGFDGLEIKEMYRELRELKGNQKLIASGLQTLDDFSFYYRCGFDHFTGPFVSSRENWHPAKSEINRLRVMEVLNMIRSGAEFDAVGERLRTDPVLTFKLLRYINSAGIGLQRKITEISQALLVLGSERFYRWLSLLLFNFSQLGYRERVLNEQALTRARFLEMLAGKGTVPAAVDQLFITGLFSLMDVMMGCSLEDVLKQIMLPGAVADALRGNPGAMTDALLLSIAIESGSTEEMEAAATLCGLDSVTVTSTMLEALAWAQQMSAVSE